MDLTTNMSFASVVTRSFAANTSLIVPQNHECCLQLKSINCNQNSRTDNETEKYWY